MKRNRWPTVSRVLLLAIMSFTTVVQADLIYQPPPGTKEDHLWREAGSLLLEGIARVFDGLAAVESTKKELAQKHLEDGVSKLKSSSGSYVKLVEAIKLPRKVSIADLSLDQQERIKRTFDVYKVPMPEDEKALARLAINEIKRIMSFLSENRTKVIGADLRTVQNLLSEITRLQRIGTHSAELMLKLR